MPVIEVIGVTDYYVTETYERVRSEQALGRLPHVSLVFPNIELRLDVAAKSGFVNMHLFVSPEDEDHVEQVQRLLSRLHFRAHEDWFDCTRADLIRLGKRSDPAIIDEKAALSYGATQFKVSFAQLREVFEGSDWAKSNIRIAVAGGAGDGTAGVREAADQTIRAEIESFADIIFASSAAQREFWLGQRTLSKTQIRERYRGLKPCLHGSDAHKLEDVATPFGDRFSWLKGALTFDSLRQACIDPAGRAHVGAEPPQTATPSQVIDKIEVADASWAKTPVVQLNPGLVAIIGARGSGKTALADMIAAGCDAIAEETWEEEPEASPSFLVRAKPLIGNAKVSLTWAAGRNEVRALDGSDANDPFAYSRARYLSQQFVEDLCSGSGISDGLKREIQRVVFDAHPFEDRDLASDFDELLNDRAGRPRQARRQEAEAVARLSDQIALELEKEQLVASYESQVAQKTQLITNYTNDRAKLVPVGADARDARHIEVTAALDAARTRHRRFINQRQVFVSLQDEVKDVRTNRAPESLRQTRSRYPNSGLNDQQWDSFLLDFQGAVDDDLVGYLKWVDGKIADLKGQPLAESTDGSPLIADGADLSAQTIAALEAEQGRLAKLVGADEETQRQYGLLTSRITAEGTALDGLKEKLEDAKGAKARRQKLQQDRAAAYHRAFEAVVAEQAVLEDLYRPLMTKLASAPGTLRKLTFTVARTVDVEKWASEAEKILVDRRVKGPFRGVGALVQHANELLAKPWRTGSADEIVAAMKVFRETYQEELLEHAPVARTDQTGFRNWSKTFASWLYSTDHIGLEYGIHYDGVEIGKLSPGTRGIVLLLLYLALDDADDRPLIIDQPEENLDPKSVFDELVPLFIAAKSRRQVIMVTHNANLVVNTDADQIIIAEAGPHEAGGLPPIKYVAGGLESDEIRKAVCDILEGGESALQERARRLRVRLPR